MTITRKMTGKVVGRDVPVVQLDLILSNLPAGVYGIENADGAELTTATVKSGRATIANPAALAG
jgi:hypothetical protein